MMKNKKGSLIIEKLLMTLLTLVIVVNAIMPSVVLAVGSNEQVVDDGGTNNSAWNSANGYVSVSKELTPTSVEDEFDITLKVKTKNDIKSIISNERVAVVIVTDMSNTMKSAINGSDLCPNSPYTTKSCVKDEITDAKFKKMKAGLAATEIQNLVSNFVTASNGITGNKIGVVGFNTNGFPIKAMEDLVATGNKETFNKEVYSTIMQEMKKYEAKDDKNRFTNIEAGLKMAQEWLSHCTQKNKYVIFLSDGLPTVYLQNNQTCSKAANCKGVDPFKLKDGLSTIKASEPKYTKFGPNYSETAARKARDIAMQLKNNKVNILSVGVGLNTFNGTPKEAPKPDANYVPNIKYGELNIYTHLNGEQMLVNQIHRAIKGNAYTIENPFNYTNDLSVALKQDWELLRNFSGLASTNYYWDGTNPQWYRGESDHSLTSNYGITNNTITGASANDKLFKQWLQYGIGSGKYWDVSDNAGLAKAIKAIIDDLKSTLSRITRVWTTVDPMGTVQTNSMGISSYIEFKGFILPNGTTSQGPLTGSNGANNTNTASFTPNETSGTINWDLKNSGYSKTTEDGKTVYNYSLKYKVRLKVESQEFESNTAYKTNDTTTLTYAIDVNNQLEEKSINYPIPEVKNYLGDLKISKTVKGLASPIYDHFDSNNSVFTFIVKFKDANNNAVSKKFSYEKYDKNGNVIANSNGIIDKDHDTLTLEDGQYAIIHGLYHDIHYTVEEVAHDGFVTGVTGSPAKTTLTSVLKDSGYQVSYTNTAYHLKLKKFDSEKQTPLQGVKFTLYRTYDESSGTFSDPVTNMNGSLLKDMLTDSDGVIDFGNISFTAGGRTTYYLVEEDTIDRYCLLDSYIKVIVDSNGITTEYSGNDANIQTSKLDDNLGNTFEISAPNNIGIELPVTGGYGSIYYTVCGMVLMLIAGIGYKKLMKEQ